MRMKDLIKMDPDAACLCLIKMRRDHPRFLSDLVHAGTFPDGFLHTQYDIDKCGKIFISDAGSYNIGYDLLRYSFFQGKMGLILKLLEFDVAPTPDLIAQLVRDSTSVRGQSHSSIFPQLRIAVRAVVWTEPQFIESVQAVLRDSSRVFTTLHHCIKRTIRPDLKQMVSLLESYAPDHIEMLSDGGSKMQRAIASGSYERIHDLILSGHILSAKESESLMCGKPEGYWIFVDFHSRWNRFQPLFFMYGPRFRSAMQALLLVLQFSLRTEGGVIPLPYLPAELWFIIMEFLRREDHYDSSIHQTVRTTRCENRLKQYYHDRFQLLTQMCN